MKFIGIDPGASGAIAALETDYPDEGLTSVTLCRLSDTEQEVSRFMRSLDPEFVQTTFALIERVHSMPKQGVASSFKFGQSYGFLRGLLTCTRFVSRKSHPRLGKRRWGV